MSPPPPPLPHGNPADIRPQTGPGDCQEFELSLTAKGLTNLFNFLSGVRQPPLLFLSLSSFCGRRRRIPPVPCPAAPRLRQARCA